MNIDKRRILMKSDILSQFDYCSLAWMCHRMCQSLNNAINLILERALQIVYIDDKSRVKELL